MRNIKLENDVVSPVARAMVLERRWLKKQEKIYPPRVIKVLARLLSAHVERLEGGGAELSRIERLVEKAERCGVNGDGLVGILATIRNVFEPSSVRRNFRARERR
jgi:hypothetical protein